MFPPNKSQKGNQHKIIVFGGTGPGVITQRDLAEERALSIEFARAAAALERKQNWIRARLSEGWAVEEGLWHVTIVKKLVVR
jgi:hypothetical protein